MEISIQVVESINVLAPYLRSAKKGVRSAISWKSSMVRGMSAALAIANRCSTLKKIVSIVHY